MCIIFEIKFIFVNSGIIFWVMFSMYIYFEKILSISFVLYFMLGILFGKILIY